MNSPRERRKAAQLFLSNPPQSLVLPGESYALTCSRTGEASLYRITTTVDAPGATWTGN